ncbi:MAG: energy transducer TonB [Kofleriaceae bacterium]
MRAGVMLALMASTSFADTPKPILDAITAGDAKKLATLVESVNVDHVWFYDPACAKKFGADHLEVAPADVPALLGCVRGLGLHARTNGDYIYEPGARFAIIAMDLPNGKPMLVFGGSIGAAGPVLLVTEVEPHRVRGSAKIQPDPTTKKAIDANPTAVAYATISFCVDAKGNVTDAGVAEPSDYQTFDATAIAQIRQWTFKPFRHGSAGVPVCTMTAAKYPLDRDVPRPPAYDLEH